MQTVVPLVAAIIALVFALFVFDQYLAQRKPHQLLWTAGLLLWALGTGAEFVVQAYWFNGVAFRLWYIAGAFLTAATLGQGTLYLLAPRPVAHAFAALLVVGAVIVAVLMFTVDINVAATYAAGPRAGERVLQEGAPITGRSGVLPAAVGYLTIPFNTFGVVTLIGGALWSAVVFALRRHHPQRAVCNVLIATGAMVLALGGTSADVGAANFRYLSELIGVIIMFAGFLASRDIKAALRVPLLHRAAKPPG